MEWRKRIRCPREDDTLAFGIPLSEALLEAPTPRQPQVGSKSLTDAADAAHGIESLHVLLHTSLAKRLGLDSRNKG